MGDTPHKRLSASLRGLIDSTLATVQTRIELLVVEVREEKLRAASFLFNTVLSALFLAFGVVFLAVFLTVLWWDEHRLLVLGISTAALFVAGLFTAGRATREFKRSNRLFSASLAELSQDRETLRHGE
ncbi:phage holin family protein [Cognatazoarcus halotolerans]|uniref:phage holin family protein n=1 Tax=Cognatazoarcus halotolerans TaxID=2686016 RepID=UPI00135B8D6F|nr:phage holin family protein [Cognatazoarcus halotolerans]MCB1900572.1 phage holin family protein [Rhodocyclaceae bacterium]MCP5310576.1 phage holin family protein [Zoogloeaceae bacterium]